jgi:hypothetical protein
MQWRSQKQHIGTHHGQLSFHIFFTAGPPAAGDADPRVSPATVHKNETPAPGRPDILRAG